MSFAAEAEALHGRIDGERPEHQRRTVRAGRDMPQAHGADDLAVALDDERQAVGRHAALAQAFAGLLEPAGSEAGIEQRLARFDIAEGFFADRDHGRGLPIRVGEATALAPAPI